MQQPGTALNRQAANPGAAGGAAAAARPRFGGLFGGLLAGTLIGSMLMGGGFAGIGLMDIVIIGGIIYLIMRFVRRRPAGQQGGQTYRTQNSSGPEPRYGQGAAPHGGQPSAWDRLRDDRASTGDPVQPVSASAGGYDTAWNTLESAHKFDREEFLRGAKLAYVRLQESWDKRDLDDIAEFATPAVVDGLRQQMREEPGPSVTELLLVNADFMDFEQDGDAQRASVLFDVMMREDQTRDETEQVREIWHFLRQDGGMWKLDGIQQVQ